MDEQSGESEEEEVMGEETENDVNQPLSKYIVVYCFLFSLVIKSAKLY